MKTLVVGDLHGKLDIAYRALSQPYNIVFVGDCLDSFTETKEDQIDTLKLVMDHAERFPDTVTLLASNHEMSYLEPTMRCSGWNNVMQSHINPIASDLRKILKPYTFVGDYLISHAGVSNNLLKLTGETLDEYLASGEFYDIGCSRGGRAYYGGLLWCDWWEEFECVPGQRQIVGHSNYRPTGSRRGIVTKELDGEISYNIDCLDYCNECLLIHEDGITVEIVEI